MDSMIWAIIKMVLALGIVCSALFFLTRLLKRNGLSKRILPLDSEIRLLTTQLIAPRKYISLVEIGGEVLALGISETQITFLTKIENKEFVQRLVDTRSNRPAPFFLFHNFSRSFKGPKLGLLRRLNGK
jgi:flagellar biogenesis protein FliO